MTSVITEVALLIVMHSDPLKSLCFPSSGLSWVRGSTSREEEKHNTIRFPLNWKLMLLPGNFLLPMIVTNRARKE